MFKHGPCCMVFPLEEIGMLLRKDLICSYKDFCGQAYQSQIETHIWHLWLYINVTIAELQLSQSICDSLLSPRYTVRAASTAPTVWGGSDKIFPCIVTLRKHQEPASKVRAELYYDCIMIVLFPPPASQTRKHGSPAIIHFPVCTCPRVQGPRVTPH